MRVLTGNHHGHVVVEDLDRQVVPLLPQELLGLALLDHPGPVVRIDDVVARLKQALDGADLVADLDRFLRCYFWNCVLLLSEAATPGDRAFLLMDIGRRSRPRPAG